MQNMKSIRNVLTAALITAAAMSMAAADTSNASEAGEAPASQPAPPGSAERSHRDGPWHLLGKLGLSDQQKQQIKEIMAAQHPEMESLREQMHANSAKLEQVQPTDPSYAGIAAQVSQIHGSLSAQMMLRHADLRAQVFQALTPAQQARLATLEAETRPQRLRGSPGPGF
jgi:periplasmic protein CpxP/Spy